MPSVAESQKLPFTLNPRPTMNAPSSQPDPSPPATHGVELAPGVHVPADRILYKAARASGPGGQNVNKRSTKVELRIALADLPVNSGVIARLRRRAPGRITDDSVLVITSSEQRSQLQNKEACLERLRELVKEALIPPKPRRPTKPTKGSKERRLDEKTKRSGIKRGRQSKPDHD